MFLLSIGIVLRASYITYSHYYVCFLSNLFIGILNRAYVYSVARNCDNGKIDPKVHLYRASSSLPSNFLIFYHFHCSGCCSSGINAFPSIWNFIWLLTVSVFHVSSFFFFGLLERSYQWWWGNRHADHYWFFPQIA